MKIGIMSEGYGDDCMDLLSDCDEVVVLQTERITTNDFYQVVTSHIEDELIVPSVEAIGLQIIQLLPTFKELVSENKIMRFILKDQSNLLTDEVFFSELYHLALMEETVIKRRTAESIRKAKDKGTLLGRPKIDHKLINKIRRLHIVERKTIREIAAICNVSIGTAFKYTKE